MMTTGDRVGDGTRELLLTGAPFTGDAVDNGIEQRNRIGAPRQALSRPYSHPTQARRERGSGLAAEHEVEWHRPVALCGADVGAPRVTQQRRRIVDIEHRSAIPNGA